MSKPDRDPRALERRHRCPTPFVPARRPAASGTTFVPNAILSRQRDAPVAGLATRSAANAAAIRAAPRRSPPSRRPDSWRARFGPAAAIACCALGAMFAAVPGADAAETVLAQAREIEAQLYGHPKRAQADLAALVERADGASGMERRYVWALYGQALVAAGRTAEALALADRLEREASNPQDDLLRATALLVRGTVEWRAGDAAKANTLAKGARALLRGAADPYPEYLAAMTIGVTARIRGQLVEGMGSLLVALSMAERDGDAYRCSGALYQLSNLYLMLTAAERARREPAGLHFAEVAEAPPAW
jgi:tetratricopeptide (TPR) repeat protein